MFFKKSFHKAIAAIDNDPANGSEQGRWKTFQKGVTILDAIENIDSLRPFGLYSPRNSSGQNTGVGSRSLLQRIFPTQRWNPGLPHCRRILYQLSHKGSPMIHRKRSNYLH